MAASSATRSIGLASTSSMPAARQWSRMFGRASAVNGDHGQARARARLLGGAQAAGQRVAVEQRHVAVGDQRAEALGLQQFHAASPSSAKLAT